MEYLCKKQECGTVGFLCESQVNVSIVHSKLHCCAVSVAVDWPCVPVDCCLKQWDIVFIPANGVSMQEAEKPLDTGSRANMSAMAKCGKC